MLQILLLDSNINLTIGNIGHLFVITSFVSALLATIAYFLSSQYQSRSDIEKEKKWKIFGRTAFIVHGLSVVGVVFCLFNIIYYHRYEYHYAWSHSSNNLPVYYMISCFWEGQEGSFLLWIFWHALLGTILILTNKFWEGPVMAVFSSVQLFLASMILGVMFLGAKIGSDPFILLRDSITAPIFQVNPNYVPEDGTGLNPLLQNYWMVIHPPTLFLGFATTLIPFAYCIAGLWQKKYREWVRPALPWALFSGAILGLGILMGGYWAYETLNFGGYWNWDPVENAVYVPWLILVAAIHTMIAFKQNSTALKSAMILSITTFLLILYATFLTRSGILGNASVHSFTDLGLSGQLFLYLIAFTGLSVFLLIYRWKSIPTSERETSVYSREFWIFLGALTLCLAGFQVLFTTSIPAFNTVIESFGFVANLALPVDQIAHYTKFQIWAAVIIAILSGTGQFFWWNKMDDRKLQNALIPPFAFALLISSAIIAFSGMNYWKFIILLTASVYTIVANFIILMSLLRSSSMKLTGGAFAHIGLGMMLLGIMFSSGYSKVVSKNNSGLLYSKDWSNEMNEENVLLWYNQAVKMNEYQVTYKGDYIEAKGFPSYIRKTDLEPAESVFQAIASKEIVHNGKTYFKKGDTLNIYPENTYFKVEYRDEKGRIFELFPRAQVNPQMGLLASPDIQRQWGRDLYTHVSSIPDPEKGKEWSETKEYTASLNDTLFLNDYVAVFENRIPVSSQEVMQLTSSKEAGKNDVGIKAVLKIYGKDQIYEANPIFLIKDGEVGLMSDKVDELGLRISLLKVNPETGEFTFGVNTTQKDYIIMKAIEKPMINILWIGTLVVMFGFAIAIFRRYTEFVKMRNKGMEA